MALINLNTLWLRLMRMTLLGSFLFTFLILHSSSISNAQCNTTLNKLLPDATVNNDDRFGSAIAANEQYLVVAAESSDTLGIYYGGAAYVYEKTVAGWAYRAMLKPSDSNEFQFFGNKVAIDANGNTIVVINRDYKKGGAYIFEKPASGWETMHETVKINFPEYLEFNSALDISDDGSTIIVSNPMSNNGLLYLLQKPITGWTNEMTPEIMVARANNSSIWLGNDVIIQDDYIYASASNESFPAIHVYKKSGSSYLLIAKLSSSIPSSFLGYFGSYMTITNNMIATTGLAYQSNEITQQYFLFKKNGEWTDMNETALFQIPDLTSYRFPYPIQFTSPSTLAAGVLIKNGDFFTGRVVELTTHDNSWQDISVSTLFEDHELSIPSEFANDMVWNGSDLLLAAVRKNIDYTFRNSILSLTKSLGIWGSLQQVVLPRNSSSNVYFGTSIVKTKEFMFAGAPYDGTVGRGAGAVYIYNQVGTEFIKVNTIYPSPRKTRPTGGSDSGFGYSMSVYQDEMAIGAPSFLYAPNSYGKIFMYRRLTNDWRSVVLYDSLIVPEELKLINVGVSLAMNDHVLFASAFNDFNNEHTNAVVIFERVNNKWSYKQSIKMGKPLEKFWPSIKFSLNGDQLAVGEYFTIDGGVSILNRNSVSGLWEITAFIRGDTFSGLGSSVKLLDNHLFVGAPGLSFNNVYRSGAVAVFTKLPGEKWQSNIQATALIGANNPIEGAFFGSSLDVVGNTMVVGAPGMFLTYDYQVRTIPGNSYVIQSHDYFWKNTTQYLNLQGDRYASNERDHFGSCVTLDEEYFYIGARNENTATGMFSGAIYYIPTPPVIFLQPPVCLDNGPVTLKGYPFDGIWKGTGVDSNLGTFDPTLAGIGTFMLTYSTPNCNYEGTVQMEVKSPPVIRQLSPADVLICTQSNTTLKLEPIIGATYNWYYRQYEGNEFVWLLTGSANFVATNPGDYKAIVTIPTQCSSESPTFRLRLENYKTTVGPQEVVCSPSENVLLIASDNTGVWEGIGVSDNKFNSSDLNNGYYNLFYRITTPTGCQISLKDSIKLNVVKPITISQTSNDFCETGAAVLQAMPFDNTLEYSWFYKKIEIDSMLPINQLLSDKATVFERGYYQVSATNGECSNTSNTIEVGFDSNLPYLLFPKENSKYQLCNSNDFTLTVEAQEGTNYIWQYKSDSSDTYQIITEETSGKIVVSEDGLYKVKGEYGFCSFESLPVSLQFFSDELFVPNVFTPNGDDKNSSFEVKTILPITRFSIFNRWGHEIYSNSNGAWDGGEAPEGVYFWYLIYNGCEQQKELKGWVQLIR